MASSDEVNLDEIDHNVLHIVNDACESSEATLAGTQPPADEKSYQIEASTELKLQCVIYVLFLVAIGLVATVIETVEFTSKCHNTSCNNRQRSPTEWICYAVKCGSIILGILALLYLKLCAIQQGKIPKVELHCSEVKGRAPNSRNYKIALRNVDRFVNLPDNLSASPSKLLIAMSALFAFFSCLSFVIEITCGAIALTQPEDSDFPTELSEVFRRLLLLVFIILQTGFFLLHTGVSFQWRLQGVWFAASHIMATNLSAWFINVGFELREEFLVNGSVKVISPNLFCRNTSIDSIAEALYPFLIEYYVMSALFAYALLANTGRLALALRESASATLTTDYIKSLLSARPHSRSRVDYLQTEYRMLKDSPGTIAIGVGLVLLALAVSVFVRASPHQHIATRPTTFMPLTPLYCTLIILYSFGIFYTVKLLRALKMQPGNRQLSDAHRIDRALLWLGTAAINVNESYTFWISWTNIQPPACSDAPYVVNNILPAVGAFLNICQSLMQVYALECTLVRKFFSEGKRHLHGRALLTFLILLNAAEWLINTICIHLFFPQHGVHTNNIIMISYLTVPLQVFYRFHSIACIHDFKKHCGEQDSDASEDSEEERCVEVQFPHLLGH